VTEATEQAEEFAGAMVTATAETLRWARVAARRLRDASGGWDDISVHHNDRRWSLAYDKAWGALPSADEDTYCPF
jgi:hypothetical protein